MDFIANHLKSSSWRFFIAAQLDGELHAVGEDIVEVLHASLNREPGRQWGCSDSLTHQSKPFVIPSSNLVVSWIHLCRFCTNDKQLLIKDLAPYRAHSRMLLCIKRSKADKLFVVRGVLPERPLLVLSGNIFLKIWFQACCCHLNRFEVIQG